MKIKGGDDGGGGGKGGSQQKLQSTVSESKGYLDTVKGVLEEQGKLEKFREFVQLLKQFRLMKIDVPAMADRVKILFHGHPDLILGFNAFLPKSHQITLLPPPENHPPPVSFREAMSLVNKIKMRFPDEDDVYESFLRIISSYIFRSSKPKSKSKENNNRSSGTSQSSDDHEAIGVIYQKVAVLFKDHPDLLSEFTLFLPTSDYSPVSPARNFSSSSDYSQSEYEYREKCTPSYTLLPKNSPNPSPSRRTELGSQVLNDYCVQRVTDSCAGSGNRWQRTEHEKCLFRCEDDRFELDVLLESTKSTARRVEQVLEQIHNKAINPDEIRLEDHFTPVNLRCIERLYGEYGLEVMDAFRENTAIVLPVILGRLKQKQQAWEACRSDFNLVWAQVYANNPITSAAAAAASAAAATIKSE